MNPDEEAPTGPTPEPSPQRESVVYDVAVQAAGTVIGGALLGAGKAAIDKIREPAPPPDPPSPDDLLPNK